MNDCLFGSNIVVVVVLLLLLLSYGEVNIHNGSNG